MTTQNCPTCDRPMRGGVLCPSCIVVRDDDGYQRVAGQLRAEIDTLRGTREALRERAAAAEARVQELEALCRDYSAGALLQNAEWQPIETAPQDGPAILVWSPQVNREAVAWTWDGAEWDSGIVGGVGVPTHWMPLPAPPTETPR